MHVIGKNNDAEEEYPEFVYILIYHSEEYINSPMVTYINQYMHNQRERYAQP